MAMFRVIDNQTGLEANPVDIAIDEEWAAHLVWCDMENFALLPDGTLILLDECGNYAYCPDGRFTINGQEI